MRKDSIAAIQSLQLMQKDGELDFMQFAGTLWRGKWLIMLCMLLALVVGAYYAFAVAVPRYAASTTVALESRDSQVVDFESVVSGLSADQATINTEVEVLRARILIGKMVDQLKLAEDPEFNRYLRPKTMWSLGGMLEELGLKAPRPEPSAKALRNSVVDEVLRIIAISNPRNSYVFRIAASTESPEKSALIADTLAQIYINDQLFTKFEATEQATGWLTDRVNELKLQLEAAETRVKEYNRSIDLIGPEALEALNRQLKDLRGRLVGAEQTRGDLARRVETMEEAQRTNDILAMGAAAGDEGLIASVSRASNNPAAREAFDVRFNALLTQLQVSRDREALQGRALRASVKDIESRVEAQSADLVKLQQLQREAVASGQIYDYFLSRLKETSVQQGIQQADSRILSYAVEPEEPSRPRKGIIMGLSMIAGLVLGVVLVLLREMQQTGFRSAQDLEDATGLTVIGQVPRAPKARRRKVLDYVVSKPTSAMAEAVRNLRTSILLSNIDTPPQVIMMTSSVPGEGKTTQTLALAQNLSGLRRKVLVIEGDIRRRTFREYFDITESNGLLSAVSGQSRLEDVVWRSDQLGVDILVGEESSINA
ncbi:MAG: GNVR domain-containing protein, partial [Pseudomonadota bacterium]